MTDQIPTTVQVRHKYATVLDKTQGWRYSEEWGADFDRWLAAHVAAAVQAERLAQNLEARAPSPGDAYHRGEFMSGVRSGLVNAADIVRSGGSDE